MISEERSRTPMQAKTKALSSGERIELEFNTVMNEKKLSFSAALPALGGGKVIIGHGKSEYGASFLEIDATRVKVFSHYTDDVLRLDVEHGLALRGSLSVTVDTDSRASAAVTVESDGGRFCLDSVFWEGRNGSPRCEAIGINLTDVSLSWECRAHQSELFAFGDSYFNLASPARWPYYLLQSTGVRALMVGYPGMNSEAGLSELKTALSHGTPKTVLWCLGMNDPDEEDAPNPRWLAGAEYAKAVSEESGMELILSTVPNAPGRSSMRKNEWIRKSGYRYVDFAKAVGAEEKDSEWYEGMLFTDRVHPTADGAKALYVQAIADCPELLK